MIPPLNPTRSAQTLPPERPRNSLVPTDVDFLRAGRGPLRLQFREQVHGVEHFAVGVVELQDAHVDHPHREHLGHAVTPCHAPTAIDADVFLQVVDVNDVGTEFEKMP